MQRQVTCAKSQSGDSLDVHYHNEATALNSHQLLSRPGNGRILPPVEGAAPVNTTSHGGCGTSEYYLPWRVRPRQPNAYWQVSKHWERPRRRQLRQRFRHTVDSYSWQNPNRTETSKIAIVQQQERQKESRKTESVRRCGSMATGSIIPGRGDETWHDSNTDWRGQEVIRLFWVHRGLIVLSESRIDRPECIEDS